MEKENLKVLVVLTSHDQLGDTGNKTGFWIEEFAAPYYVMADAGVDVTIASPKGGQPPIDPKSALPEFQTEATKRFDGDKELQAKLANSMILSEVEEQDYDAIFYPGGHGPLWDLANDKTSICSICWITHDKFSLDLIVMFLSCSFKLQANIEPRLLS